MKREHSSNSFLDWEYLRGNDADDIRTEKVFLMHADISIYYLQYEVRNPIQFMGSIKILAGYSIRENTISLITRLNTHSVPTPSREHFKV